MHDKNKSQSAFDEIKDYSIEQLSTLLGHALVHIDKFCNERLADFTAIFGADLKMLDSRMQRFMAGLK